MMLVPATAFLVALAGALVLTPLVRRAAVDAELLDEPGGRKIHVRAIPRLGGAAMLVAFGMGVAVGLLASRLTGQELGEVTAQLLPVLVGVTLVAGVGLFDDLWDLRPLAKLAGQLVASVAVVALGLSFSDLATPWFTIQLGIFGPLLTIAWLVAVANAVNLIDGLDGLAGGVSLATLLAFGGIAASQHAPMVLMVTAAGAGAVAAFLVHNRPPASIIMGDAGSMLLGMLLGTSAVALVTRTPGHATLPAAAVALGVPLADMTWAILRRLAAGRSIFAADSSHIHHQLMLRGLGQGAVTLILVAASAVLGLLAVVIAR